MVEGGDEAEEHPEEEAGVGAKFDAVGEAVEHVGEQAETKAYGEGLDAMVGEEDAVQSARMFGDAASTGALVGLDQHGKGDEIDGEEGDQAWDAEVQGCLEEFVVRVTDVLDGCIRGDDLERI